MIKKVFKLIVLISITIMGFSYFAILGLIEETVYTLSDDWKKDAWGRWCRIK